MELRKENGRLMKKEKILSLLMTILMVLTIIMPIGTSVHAEGTPGTDGITTSTGETIFSVGNPGVVVDSNLSITGAVGTIAGAQVMIRNFQNGDQLTVNSFPGISSSFNTANGVLTLFGNGTTAQYQEVFRTVKFTTTSSNQDKRTIDFILGTGLYFSGNGHFYEYVTSPGITWNDAVQQAATKTLFGLTGYLVTITSQAENDFILNKTNSLGWIGARDINRNITDGSFITGVLSDGDWRWVTGPEGEADGGKGLKFYSGYTNSGANGTPVDGQFENWYNDVDSQEPNNWNLDGSAGEWVAHIYGSGYGSQSGKWNDFRPTQSTVFGYVVEYGGMTDDANLRLQASKDVSIIPKLSTPTGLTWDITTPGKAKWTAVTNASSYTVQLKKDGVDSGAAVSASATEYDFTSVITANGTYTFTVMAVGNQTTYANSETATVGGSYNYYNYTVTFNSDGGSDIQSQKVPLNGKVTAPADPTRLGYTFNGWYTDNTYSTLFDFVNTAITKDTTIYAKWINLGPTGSIIIDNGSNLTNNLTVSLAIQAADPEGDTVTHMSFSNDGSNWAQWEPLVGTKQYTLPLGDGKKTVYIRFKDNNGNVGISSSASITLDTTPAAIAGVTNKFKYNTNVTPSFTEGIATLSKNGGAASLFTSGTVISEEGNYTIVLTDLAGNANTVTFTIDKTAPFGTLTINNGETYTTLANVKLTITASDANGSGAEKMRFSNDGTTWSVWEAVYSNKDWTLTSNYGTSTVYMQIKDGAENVSSSIIDTIQYKSIPVLEGNLLVNGKEDTNVQLSVTNFVYSNADGSKLEKIMILSLPINGALELKGTSVSVSQEVYVGDLNQLVFIPNINWNGITSFNWRGSDGINYSSNTATITINIEAVNDLPKATAGSITVNAGEPSNGRLIGEDEDMDALIYSIVNQGSKGTVTITDINTGAYTYVPKDGEFGADSFTFKVNDGKADSNTAIVTAIIILSGIADLGGLTIDHGVLTPNFAKNTMDYDANVVNSVENITVTASVYDKYSTIKIGNISVATNAYGVYSEVVALQVGKNIIPVEITAQDGTKKLYKVTVTREPSSNANLLNLVTSVGSLNPAFTTSKTEYIINIGNEITEITLIPTSADNTAVIRVNGAEVLSGNASNRIALLVGNNELVVDVLAQDETTTIKYKVIVNRAASSNANITNISLGNVKYTPKFNADINEYYANVEYSTSEINIATTLADNTALVKINNEMVNGNKKLKLNVGSNIITIEVTAQDGITKKIYTFTINRKTSPSPIPDNKKTDVEILVNGKVEYAGIANTINNGDKTITTVLVDEKKVQNKLEQEGKNAVVTIPVNTKADVVIGELNGQMVKNMEEKLAVLEIKTETTSYILPAGEIKIDAVSEQIGKNVELKDIKVKVEIAKSSNDTVKIVEDSAKAGEFTIVVSPVEFTVTCTYANNVVEVKSFNSYIERNVAIPEDIDPKKITTGIVIESDGTVRHVPTKVIMISGKYFAKINSLTNSTYSVVYHPLEFKDVETHWSKEAVNDMGSRMVISGIGDGLFEPDRDITRAEFSAIVVRALGLKPGTGKNPFADVKSSDWYCGYIETAYQYGIISGYGDGNFGPMDKITREQAMTMIARTMKITGLKVEFAAGDIENLLKGFKDSDKSAEYAKTSIATCIKTGIVAGRGENMVAPKDNITRAEVATIIRRLLQKSNLI